MGIRVGPYSYRIGYLIRKGGERGLSASSEERPCEDKVLSANQK